MADSSRANQPYWNVILIEYGFVLFSSPRCLYPTYNWQFVELKTFESFLGDGWTLDLKQVRVDVYGAIAKPMERLDSQLKLWRKYQNETSNFCS